MTEYKLSVKAEQDLAEIYFFSYQKFGELKADAYLIGLEECLSNLANNPFLGRNIEHIRKGYFRYEYISHSVFYKPTGKGILVVRILHGSMDMERHLSES
jgi:toxin ParE1/3/4